MATAFPFGSECGKEAFESASVGVPGRVFHTLKSCPGANNFPVFIAARRAAIS